MASQELVEEVWDVKKIIIGIVSLVTVVAGAYGVKKFIIDKNIHNNPSMQQSVRGEKTSDGSQDETLPQTGSNKSDNPPASFSAPSQIKNTVEQRIQSIREEITRLSVTEVASSSPQIQKIIQDIQQVEQYPSNQAKNVCQKICDGI